ncbi:MAG: YdiU family protein [Moraxella sp.]|nr:YdiU family protein [Moraxella sp.]
MKLNPRYLQLDSALYHLQRPTPLGTKAIAGHFNEALATQLNWTDDEKNDWLLYCSGHQYFASPSLAMAYAGHQFGHWAGQLGDGRGLLMAQVIDIHGETIDLHLKGAGQTPYSRMGDGRAVLRSTIREYLGAHALTALGIPSSNALGFSTSDTHIRRERLERGAMLLRTCDSHIRLGHFEWLARFYPQYLPTFVQHCIAWHYPECLNSDEPILAWVRAVIAKTASLIAQWQLTGFVHGVMNTDNLSITGTTIDFGPFVFMERHRPSYAFNHSDSEGRYVYENQPKIAKWNLWVWVSSLLSLAPTLNHSLDTKRFSYKLLEALDEFDTLFDTYFYHGLAKKMGLPFETLTPTDKQAVIKCTQSFLKILKEEQLDFTNSFRHLTDKNLDALRNECLDGRQFDEFTHQYHHLRQFADIQALTKTMQQVNPIYILRTQMAQTAIDHANDLDFSEVARLFTLLTHPFTKQPSLEKPSDITPLDKKHTGISLSCSS